MSHEGMQEERSFHLTGDAPAVQAHQPFVHGVVHQVGPVMQVELVPDADAIECSLSWLPRAHRPRPSASDWAMLGCTYTWPA